MAVKFALWTPKTPRPDNLPDSVDFMADESKGTVILIHGLTGTPHEMKALAVCLQRAGYSVICPRLAWHGEPLYLLKRARWQEFYQSVKDAYHRAPADKPVFTAGLSMGALLALLLAEEFPERIAGTACFSPTLFYDGWNVSWSRFLLPLMYFTPLRNFFYHKEELPYGIKNEKIRARIHKYYKTAKLSDSAEAVKYGYPYFPATLFCELRKVINNLKKKLSAIKSPVLLVQAYDDDMTSPKNSRFIHRTISSSRKEIFFLYNSYHVITADQEREKAAEKMKDFFDSITGQAIDSENSITEKITVNV